MTTRESLIVTILGVGLAVFIAVQVGQALSTAFTNAAAAMPCGAKAEVKK